MLTIESTRKICRYLRTLANRANDLSLHTCFIDESKSIAKKHPDVVLIRRTGNPIRHYLEISMFDINQSQFDMICEKIATVTKTLEEIKSQFNFFGFVFELSPYIASYRLNEIEQTLINFCRRYVILASHVYCSITTLVLPIHFQLIDNLKWNTPHITNLRLLIQNFTFYEILNDEIKVPAHSENSFLQYNNDTKKLAVLRLSDKITFDGYITYCDKLCDVVRYLLYLNLYLETPINTDELFCLNTEPFYNFYKVITDGLFYASSQAFDMNQLQEKQKKLKEVFKIYDKTYEYGICCKCGWKGKKLDCGHFSNYNLMIHAEIAAYYDFILRNIPRPTTTLKEIRLLEKKFESVLSEKIPKPDYHYCNECFSVHEPDEPHKMSWPYFLTKHSWHDPRLLNLIGAFAGNHEVYSKTLNRKPEDIFDRVTLYQCL